MARKLCFLVCVLVLIGAVAFAGGKKEGASGDMEIQADSITIHWAQWAPSDYLQDLSSGFTEQTGIDVVVEQTPWENFVQKYNTEMIARSDAWDIIIGDSQDLGTMATGGHYVELTDWIEENNVDEDFLEAAMTYYSEYPKGSGQYWSVPTEGDALGWAYRTDLFNDPRNQEAFQEEYGYELGVPQSFEDIADIAEFFHDPENDFYGISIYGDNGYDSLVMFAEQSMWQFGGNLGDYQTYELEGELNSEGSVRGLEFYNEVFQYTPPAFNDAFFVKANDAYTAGIVPMVANFFAFLPALANEQTNPHAADTGYFATPPQEGVNGQTHQYAALGGQGASVVSYSSKQPAAMAWLEWFIQPEVQQEWADLGGFTLHTETLNSPEFLNATPYNPALKESMTILRDFWSVPEYGRMLESFSSTVGNYIIRGQGTAQGALDRVTEQWQEIFRNAGYIE